MLIIVRSNDINPDPRVQKYIDFLIRKEVPFLVLGWNRSGEVIEKPNHKYFHLKAKYGSGHLNILNKVRWFLFVYLFLIRNKHAYDVVHACDYDTAFPAYLSKLTTKKKMIFDVFDWMSSPDDNGIIFSLIGVLERKSYLKSEYAIICEEERKEQIPVVKEHVLVMPNIPQVIYSEVDAIKNKLLRQREAYDYILSYVGVFIPDRGLEDLIKFAKTNKNICLNIAGFGSLEEGIEKAAEEHENIIFWGKVSYNDGLNLMKHADLIVAMYYKTDPVHEYAAPNKYYEGLMLGVPIITTVNTLVGRKTMKYNTGFAIEEGMQALKDLFTNKNIKKEIKIKKENTNRIWEDKYKNYVQNFLEQRYYPICCTKNS